MRTLVSYSVSRTLLVVFVLCLAATLSPGQVWINEVMFNPPGSDLPNQYVELRGTPNLLLTNTYFIAVEGDANADPGTILDVFDLSNTRIGGNGFLVILQNSNKYVLTPGAAVLANTNGAGFGSGPTSSVRHRGKNGQVSFQSASLTFFLLQTDHAPAPGDDIDTDNDGIPDDALFVQWTVLDSIGVLDVDGPGDIAYGRINFRRSDPPGSEATALTGPVVPVPFTPGYVARIRNSTNSAAADWLAADDLGGAPPRWLLAKAGTYPPAMGHGALNSLGAPNFRGPRLPGVIVRVAEPLTIIEGGAPGRYSISLNTPCRKGLQIQIAAPPSLEVSTDQGRTFGDVRVLRLSGAAPRSVLVRAQNDDEVGPLQRLLTIEHTVIASGDPLAYPTNGTIVPPVRVIVRDDDHALLSELKVNPPGTNDGPFEFVEIRGTPGASLEHLKFVAINGDNELDPGVVSTVVDLSGQRLGATGQLLIMAPSAPYAAAAGTTILQAPQLSRSEGALPNGSVTFLLLYTTNAITEGTDLDAGNNGTLEKLPRDCGILDSIGWVDERGGDILYTPAVLTLDSGTPDAASRFKNDDRPNEAAAWFGGNLATTNAESLIYDERAVTTNFPYGTTLSPGTPNNTPPQLSALQPFSSVIGDPTTPVIKFSISDAEAPVNSLIISAHSSDTNVVPNDHLVIGGSGVQRTLTINAVAVGYSTITVAVSDGQLTSERSFPYAAARDDRGGGRFHTGASDGSTGYAVDSRWLLIGDDENQIIRLYSRSNSGPAVAHFDMNPFLGLTDLYDNGTPKEVDIEASTHVGNRIFWMGSHSHSGDAEIRTNRARIFTTDISGTGTNIMLTYVGRYDYLKADLLNWDAHGEHGKPDFYYGLGESSVPGVDPKATNGSGFNIEGLAMAPNSTNTAYVGFRAPLVPPTNRVYALIVPVTNFTELAASTDAPGSARFGTPIELNLNGRGIRSIEGAGTNYLIVAGPPGPATGITPSDFKLYTWTGSPSDPPRERSTDLTGLNPEGIVALPPTPWTSNSMVQLISDNGATVLYGDAIEAKHLPIPQFKQCRTDWVPLGQVVTPRPFIRNAIQTGSSMLRIEWHSFAGVTYRVQSKASLQDRRWSDIPGDVKASSASTLKFVQPTTERRFFRIIVVKNP